MKRAEESRREPKSIEGGWLRVEGPNLAEPEPRAEPPENNHEIHEIHENRLFRVFREGISRFLN